MLPKRYRLNLEKDINFVLKSGRRASSPLFALCCVSTEGDQRKRFGFLVSKKVSNKAAGRNLVKRRMRQIVAKNLPACQPGTACVFLARPKSLTADYASLEAEILRSMRALGAWRAIN